MKSVAKKFIDYILAYLKWSALGVIVGILCGLVGAGFS